ncbi:MAG: hypothetical protein FVQ77_02815 [Cytophagales bacterium]|nr:hypothetical protein [Cytophagales bacterium]
MKQIFFFICYLLFMFDLNAQSDTIVTKSGLKYVQIKPGNGEKPMKGSKIKVNYTGKLKNGDIFDSTADQGKPFKFKLGAGEVIKGWDEGFALMSKGEKGILIIPPELGYGKKGVPDPYEDNIYVIPPNATLAFEVELLDFK